MVKVISKYNVLGDKVIEFRSIAVRLQSAAVREKGCVSFEILQSVKEESVICILEEWSDGDALAAHLQSNLFKSVMPRLHELQTGTPDVTVCRVLVS